ncbi:hypothetical protein JI739_00810 [Ramlibacter sp. AW1]|uniref:Tetratricopeptide repeat protein n=1 Tax=Ramlibacter aurantiacus TaxID=2801330 RepID=A0A936ZQ03_9BURK|nr:hypothetical protein [Ramlibacter aurantiacus]MBL0418875.1 hypothetical protein [Ramlibacter aurantiacus]
MILEPPATHQPTDRRGWNSPLAAAGAVPTPCLQDVAEDDLEILYAQAYDRLVARCPQEALEDLHRLVIARHRDTSFRYAYGLALQQVERPIEAAAQFACVLLIDAHDAGAALRLGECLEAAGDFAKA